MDRIRGRKPLSDLTNAPTTSGPLLLRSAAKRARPGPVRKRPKTTELGGLEKAATGSDAISINESAIAGESARQGAQVEKIKAKKVVTSIEQFTNNNEKAAEAVRVDETETASAAQRDMQIVNNKGKEVAVVTNLVVSIEQTTYNRERAADAVCTDGAETSTSASLRNTRFLKNKGNEVVATYPVICTEQYSYNRVKAIEAVHVAEPETPGLVAQRDTRTKNNKGKEVVVALDSLISIEQSAYDRGKAAACTDEAETSASVPRGVTQNVEFMRKKGVDPVGNVDSTVQVTYNRKSKRTNVTPVRYSCSTVGRRRSSRNKSEMVGKEALKPKAFSVPPLKPKKRKLHQTTTPTYELDWDFVNKQKAYFAEIDAFELAEELVSESELD